MTVFFNDGYGDLPPRNNPRAGLEYELGRLKALHWADAGDNELRMRIAALEAELAALNRNGGGA
jgi:hypothetical protein